MPPRPLTPALFAHALYPRPADQAPREFSTGPLFSWAHILPAGLAGRLSPNGQSRFREFKNDRN
jgi:hypothetical protein